ncbi:hypothetical protein [Brucella sp. IR073]|uniref:hypothetical protein n=1 Tax=unclassified Brucella TaxID=2632610 RepID=UPI003B97DA4D
MPVTLKSTARSLMVASALSLLMASSAFAFEGNAVAERMKELYAEQGGQLSYGQVTTSGATVVLKDATLKMPGSPAEQKPFDLGDITLDGVADAPDGGYDIAKATMPDVIFPVGELTIAAKGIEMDKMHLAPKGSSDPLASYVYYQTAKIAEATLTQDGKEFALLKDITTTVSPYKEGSPIDTGWDIKNVTVDVAKTKPSELTKALEAMGYKKITGNIVSKASWTPSDGHFKLDQFNFTMNEGGKLSATFDMGGYTLDFVKEMQQAQTELAATKDKNTAGMATLGLMQQLTVNGASIRFEDASLTGKILDYYAKKQNTDRSTIVNLTKAALPLFAGQLKNAAFAAQVTQAVGAYLDNPKSIEIRAAPPSPVPVAVLTATGSAQPERLPDVLGVTVTADK